MADLFSLIFPSSNITNVTAGLKWAPDLFPKVIIKKTRVKPIAHEFANRTTASF